MKYTRVLLDEILQEGGATLLEDYTKYNQRMRIQFRCKCGVETDKRFEMLNLHRCPYCEECSKKIHAERAKKTCLEKYGVTNASMTPEVINKINKTFQEKYGDHPKRLKETQEKWMNTCIERFGGHHNQNKDIQIKAEANSYKHRDYTLPSGKLVKIQGFEDKALDELLEDLAEEEIIVGRGNVPTIPYTCNEGKRRVYFPDFFLPSTNTILEIKSEWTIQMKTCRLEERAKAVLEKGYKFEVWVYTGTKKNKRVLTF